VATGGGTTTNDVVLTAGAAFGSGLRPGGIPFHTAHAFYSRWQPILISCGTHRTATPPPPPPRALHGGRAGALHTAEGNDAVLPLPALHDLLPTTSWLVGLVPSVVRTHVPCSFCHGCLLHGFSLPPACRQQPCICARRSAVAPPTAVHGSMPLPSHHPQHHTPIFWCATTLRDQPLALVGSEYVDCPERGGPFLLFSHIVICLWVLWPLWAICRYGGQADGRAGGRAGRA